MSTTPDKAALAAAMKDLMLRDDLAGTALTEAIGLHLEQLLTHPDYAECLNALRNSPGSDRLANAILARIREDVPVLAPLSDEQLAIYVEVGPEHYLDFRRLFLTLGQTLINLGEPVRHNAGE